jgi:UDP-glucose 4-epimerase
VIRPSNAFGERQNPNGMQGAISVFLGKAVRDEEIEIWGDGEVVRDYIYINDLVEGIYRAATMSTPLHIYNLGSGAGHSLNEILDIISQSVNKKLKITYKQQRLFDVPEIYLDISMARQDLLWQPATSLEVGIRNTWNFIQKIHGR